MDLAPFSCRTAFLACLVSVTTLPCHLSAQATPTTCASVVSYMLEKDGQSPSEVFFAEIRVSGSDEASAKTKLEGEILKVKSKAHERCKWQYENTSGCLQGKLVTSNAALQTASFAARKALEEALLNDCKKQVGTCKETKSSEAKCTIQAVPVGAETAKEGAEGKGEGKKDEKAKK